MLSHYTHSRAAILCFGGWGLQAMFHLLPRIQAVQEQRAAQGSAGPDLRSTVSFGAIMPAPLLDDNGQAHFHLYAPRRDSIYPAFFIERALAKSGADSSEGLTWSERRARALEQTLAPDLISLDLKPGGFTGPAKGGTISGHNPLRRATRQDQFLAAARNADMVSRLVETHLLDPIRQDNLDPDELFVQTTLYIVAPVFEPLASALIWPIVAQLMSRLGRRHVSQVVAMLASGSYAVDLTRPVEDGTSFAALQELEILSGLEAGDRSQERTAFSNLLYNSGSPLSRTVGDPLFDFIYLLDREKSNQGLSEESHELAVMAGNALEAMIVANGSVYIHEQLGIGLHAANERPYSLIGAATDYVPVMAMLQAVNRQEESRLVREWILRSRSDGPTQRNPLLRTPPPPERLTLADLGLDEARALSQLSQRMPELFEESRPQSVKSLRVRQEAILPAPEAARLARLSDERWPQAFTSYVGKADHTLQLTIGSQAIDEVWGIAAPGSGQPTLNSLTPKPTILDDRMIPGALFRMRRHLVELLTASPDGLNQAHDQANEWLTAVEQANGDFLSQSLPTTRELSTIQHDLALRKWAADYAKGTKHTPTLWGALFRALVAMALVAALALAYLWIVERPWRPTEDGMALLGFAAGIGIAAITAYVYARRRATRLRRARVKLALSQLNSEVQDRVRAGFMRAYDQMAQVLSGWAEMLDEAREELHTLSTPPAMPAVPPPDVHDIYLYTPHPSQALWDMCLTYLRDQQDKSGQRSEERLDILWGNAEWRTEMERILYGALNTPTTVSRDTQAHTIAQFIRSTVHRSVAPISIDRPSDIRQTLIAELSDQFSIDRHLWRREKEVSENQRLLRALELTGSRRRNSTDNSGFSIRRYIETTWNKAKPTANYDVSDRLAVYGINVDFVAAAGGTDGELTRTLLNEFNLSLLPTEDPFRITFVRTVHGLGLDDLDCMRRYADEVAHLHRDETKLICLLDDSELDLYRLESSRTGVADNQPYYPLRTE